MPSTSNKIRYGIQDVHVAEATVSAAQAVSYGTPERLPGAVNLSIDPEGDTSPFYADNVVYYRSTANNGYTGSLEMALVPDWFRIKYLGEVKDSNGVIVEQSGSSEPAYFALLFQFQGDVKAIRHVLYYCTVSRPSTEGATKEDSISPQTETLNLTADPRPGDKLVKARTGDDTASETYNSWYTAVYVPTVDSNGEIQVTSG